jgi:hypothetical protein
MMAHRQGGRDRQAPPQAAVCPFVSGHHCRRVDARLAAGGAAGLAERRRLPPGARACDPAHCEFRGGGPRPLEPGGSAPSGRPALSSPSGPSPAAPTDRSEQLRVERYVHSGIPVLFPHPHLAVREEHHLVLQPSPPIT